MKRIEYNIYINDIHLIKTCQLPAKPRKKHIQALVYQIYTSLTLNDLEKYDLWYSKYRRELCFRINCYHFSKGIEKNTIHSITYANGNNNLYLNEV